MIKLRIKYGTDLEGDRNAFYWPESPSKRRELLSVKRNNPNIYESVYQCRPGQREGSIFLETDFVYYKPPKRLSLGLREPEIISWLSRFQAVVCSWDTAFEATSDSNYTVGIAAGLLPCDQYHCGEDELTYGSCEPHLDVYLLDLTREKLDWGDLVKAFRGFHRKWNPALHLVEKRATGISLIQATTAIGMQVEGVMTTESKRARAVAGTEAGSVQGWFRQHRVLIPYETDWVDPYKTELKDFTGQEDSHDDQVDSTVHLVNYAIQLGGGMAMMSSEWTPERVIEIIDDQEQQPDMRQAPAKSDMLSWIRMVPGAADTDPMGDMCGTCDLLVDGFCSHYKRPMTIFDGCEYHLRVPVE